MKWKWSIKSLKILFRFKVLDKEKVNSTIFSVEKTLLFTFGAPTYRKNEHGNIQGKQTGIVLRGGITAVGL